MAKNQGVKLDDCVEALAKIVAAVQHKAEHGRFPQFPGNKSFDQWAGDIASKAIGYSAVPELDKYIENLAPPVAGK